MNEVMVDIPAVVNEPVREYTPGSPERISLKSKLTEMENESYEIPIIISKY